MTLSYVFTRTAESCALVDRTVVAYLRRLSDHYPHAVVDEQALAYLCAGVYLDARPVSAYLRYQTRCEIPLYPVEKVRYPVVYKSMYTRIKQDYLRGVLRRRVSLLYTADKFLYR